ncbi:hypothetical protein [Teredinibacter turnerae]|uniref:hypothetical protein n=1 Tax=Teredinibacter turnerae TaxID=2426 RepID=UPI0004249490|nr:hypothetical protein [Teredinibacter turnerae]
MRVVYLGSDEKILGEIVHTNFSSILVPFFEEGAVNTYIYRKFSSSNHEIWRIMEFGFNGEELKFKIQEAGSLSPKSLGLLAREQNSSIKKIVANFNIVEADFGCRISKYESDGGVADNESCTASHMRSELYKRRPCIVINVGVDRIQLLPLTTKSGSIEAHSMEVNEQSFSKLNKKYRVKTSRTLPNMIQSVSSFRVFPPMLADGKFPTCCFNYKLCETDRLELSNNLAAIFSSPLERKSKLDDIKIQRLEKEKSGLFRTNIELKDNLSSYEELKSKVLALGVEMGCDGEDPREIVEQILNTQG